jgi:4-amino-4-deoxy-L-arabinose transferase-like glycosyltransferase
MATLTATQADHALPRSLPASLPWLWSRVLFPGRAIPAHAIRPVALFLVVILPALILYPRLSFHLLEPDEGRYAEIPREMLQRGDVVVPYLQGQPYLDKPPLLYWLVMLSYSVFGVHDWAARLVPALAIHGTIVSLYLIGRRSVGERAAFWGSLLLGVAPGFMSMGRLLILDGLLAFCTTFALLCIFEAVRFERLRRGWWLLAAVATGLGLLTKGPVVLVLVAVPIWLYRRMQGPSCRIGLGQIMQFTGAMLAVNLPWYVAIGLREPVFLRHFFWEHNVVRFLAPFDHIRPVWFYIPVLLAGLLPATLLTVGVLRHLLSGRSERAATRNPQLGFFLLAGGWCVFFFSMSGCKLPTYILPALPPLALIVGAYVAASGRGVRVVSGILVVCAAGLLLWVHGSLLPWYAKLRSPMGEAERVRKYCADPAAEIVCFPRSCDSLAFYLKRDDLRAARSKYSLELIEMLRQQPRTVVLFTHRHSLEALRYSLPPDLVIVEVVTFKRDKNVGAWFDVLTTETPWGLCDLAVVERRKS